MQDNLRDVPAYATTKFQQELEKATLPVPIRRKLLSAMNESPVSMTFSILARGVESGAGLTSPWSLPDWSTQLCQVSGLKRF